jgi:hypothetical protein
MDTLFQASLHTHELVLFLLILSQLYFLKIKDESNYSAFRKKFLKLFLFQNVLIAMVVFTGLLMMGVMQFLVLNFKIIMMIVLIVAIIWHQFVINRRLRVIKSSEKELLEEFKAYASKIYTTQALAILILFVIAKVLK